MKEARISTEELMGSGHLACQGCGATQAMRLALKALGRQTVLVIPACCWSVIDGSFPHSAVDLPIFHTAFETAAVTASGVKAGLQMRGDTETTVVAWAGDGGTYDIGLQALSGAAERNEDIIYVCYDNEAYMNTGIQRSSSTPVGAWTTTTPVTNYKKRPKKNMIDIMAAHSIPYVATTSVAYPEDLVNKFKKAREIKGTRYIQIMAPCPTGWKLDPKLTIWIARRAVTTKVYPMIEVTENGEKISVFKDFEPTPFNEYIKAQGRFRHLSDEEIGKMEKGVEISWNKLLAKEKMLASIPAMDTQTG
ncbi:MAG: 3-methyl-2-oxobutanoate dehydrogenase subunit beta [Candidatus Latescibacteria bacterium]|nr:3-methyl-2-oxobutanoate dehydrogenase subunit beta [bacterium]MBD3423827.1 3-methyl-2-oxobutanoate dehydrogenase subunit beta [Candidatus Latescibacterota bacterium]